MSDDADRASEYEQRVRDDALQAHARHAGLQGKSTGDSALWCQACGVVIPVARREAVPGCQFCVVCKERQERRNKGKA